MQKHGARHTSSRRLSLTYGRRLNQRRLLIPTVCALSPMAMSDDVSIESGSGRRLPLIPMLGSLVVFAWAIAAGGCSHGAPPHETDVICVYLRVLQRSTILPPLDCPRPLPDRLHEGPIGCGGLLRHAAAMRLPAASLPLLTMAPAGIPVDDDVSISELPKAVEHMQGCRIPSPRRDWSANKLTSCIQAC